MNHDSSKPVRTTIENCLHIIPDNEKLKDDLKAFLDNFDVDSEEDRLDYWEIVIGLIKLRIDLNKDLDGWQKEFVEALS